MKNEKKQSPITVRELRRMARDGEPIVALTAYDALMARMADESGVHLILVGDSLGMTVLGFKNTIPVTITDALRHTAAVSRGARHALVVGDMPFLTYQVSVEDALRNAGRFLQEAGAQAVKLEGGAKVAGTVSRLVGAGIPVLGHIGLLPQSVLAEGGYRIHGRTSEEARRIMDDAKAIQDAGAFGIVLEGLPVALSAEITEALDIPTIGIGAGPACSGQVQVIHDILGLFEDFVPRHTKRYAHLADDVRNALRQYAADVTDGAFPAEEHSFK
jgi:3-methyl-2-oxobutanoate hydroxymethyltransferase